MNQEKDKKEADVKDHERQVIINQKTALDKHVATKRPVTHKEQRVHEWEKAYPQHDFVTAGKDPVRVVEEENKQSDKKKHQAHR